jgi:hypothetical protein
MSIPFNVALLDTYLQFMPVFGDAITYDQQAQNAMVLFQQGNVPMPSAFGSVSVWTYVLPLSVVYSVTGANLFAGVAFSCFFWGVAVLFWLRIGRKFIHHRIVPIAGLLFVVYPAGILYMSYTLREAPTICALSVTLWLWLQWVTDGRHRFALLAILVMVPLMLLRTEIIPPVTLALVVGWLLESEIKLEKYSLRLGLASVMSGLGIKIANIYINTKWNPLDVSLVEKLRWASARRSAGYLQGLEYTSLTDIILYLPLRLWYFVASPFFWIPSSYKYFIPTVNAIFMLIVIILSGLGLKRGATLDTVPTGLLLSYAGFILAGYSLVVSNGTVASRRHLYAVPVMILFGAYGLVQLGIRLEPDLRQLLSTDT